MRRAARRTRPRRKPVKRWVHTVTTVSTAPPRGLFTKDAKTIARVLASPRVSPKGITSGFRMLLFFINRGGRGLSRARRAELRRATVLMQEMIAEQRRAKRRSRAAGPGHAPAAAGAC